MRYSRFYFLKYYTGKFYFYTKMIKPMLKSLKFSNYGKKIYDNLTIHYGEYFGLSKKNQSFNKSTNKELKNYK